MLATRRIVPSMGPIQGVHPVAKLKPTTKEPIYPRGLDLR